MAKHLSDRDIQAIVNLIRGWPDGKLTWPAICEAAAPLIGKLPTRQSLNAHETIKIAYETKKNILRGIGSQKSRPASLEVTAARLAKLESEMEELKEVNRRYKEQFAVWQYNAYKHGMKEHHLNAPLPKIDRERTDGEKR